MNGLDYVLSPMETALDHDTLRLMRCPILRSPDAKDRQTAYRSAQAQPGRVVFVELTKVGRRISFQMNKKTNGPSEMMLASIHRFFHRDPSY
jgi:hypothetical protein